MRIILSLFILAGLLVAWPARAQQPVGQQINTIRLELFVRTDSEVSTGAIRFAEDLAARRKGLELVVHDVLQDREQLARLWQITRRSNRDKPVVPAFYCCDRIYFGFASAVETGPAIEDLYTIDVYTRSTCPKCIKAKAFFRKLSPRWPALRFRIYDVERDAGARRRWQSLCQSQGKPAGLPTIDFGGKLIIGYLGDDITGVELENLIHRVSKNRSGDREAVPRLDDTSKMRWPMRNKPTASIVGPWSLLAATQPPPETELDLDELLLPDEAEASDIGEADLAVPPSESDSPSDVIKVPVFGELRPSEMGFPLFTFSVGLVDGFNPCAMWILVFLLSVLVNIKDRRKILLIAGTFVIVSGVAYFAFMAAWLNVFMLIGIKRPVQITLGLMALMIGVVNVKDFFAFKKGITFSIPESSKPGLYKRVRRIVSAQYLTAALTGVIALAVIVNFVELLCTAGLPALYTQVLTMQEFSAWKNYGYLALYISAYMLDDAVLLGIVVATLSHRKLQEREGRWLKLISGLVILVLGLVMIFKPEWLQLGQ